MARYSDLLRLGAVAAAALASLASAEPGDRANNDNCLFDCPPPTCPTGETCSDATPGGLYFAGMSTGDSVWGVQWPRATALGGHQTIGIYYDSGASSPFSLPYSASLTTPSLSITTTDTSSLVVQGDSAGTAKLRLTEPDSDLLYDRVDLEAEPIESMYLRPSGAWFGYDYDLVDPATQYAVATGSRVRFTVVMEGGGVRVVDEGMTITGGPGIGPDPDGYVDTAEIAPAASGTVELAVKAGDAPLYRLSMQATARAARLEPWSENQPVRTDRGGEVCFRARTNTGAYLLGADWTFESSDNLTLGTTIHDVATNCVEVTATQTGTGTVTATAAGASVVAQVEIVDGSSKRAMRPRPLTSGDVGLSGDRADNAAALATAPAQP